MALNDINCLTLNIANKQLDVFSGEENTRSLAETPVDSNMNGKLTGEAKNEGQQDSESKNEIVVPEKLSGSAKAEKTNITGDINILKEPADNLATTARNEALLINSESVSKDHHQTEGTIGRIEGNEISKTADDLDVQLKHVLETKVEKPSEKLSVKGEIVTNEESQLIAASNNGKRGHQVNQEHHIVGTSVTDSEKAGDKGTLQLNTQSNAEHEKELRKTQDQEDGDAQKGKLIDISQSNQRTAEKVITVTPIRKKQQSRAAKQQSKKKQENNKRITSFFEAQVVKIDQDSDDDQQDQSLPGNKCIEPPLITVLTKSEQKRFMAHLSRRKVTVPGDGHCLWIALMLANNNCQLQNYPILTDVEEANLFEMKRALKEHILCKLQIDPSYILVPKLKAMITNKRDGKITNQDRLKYLTDFFETIAGTPSNEWISSDYWASSDVLLDASWVLQKKIYVVNFQNILGVKFLDKYDHVDGSKKGSVDSIAEDKWHEEMHLQEPDAIVLGFEEGNHFFAYKHIEKKENGGKRAESPIKKKKIHLPLSYDQEDIGNEIDELLLPDQLSGFSDLEPATREIAVEDFRHLSKPELEQYAQAHDLTNEAAAHELLLITKKNAVIKVNEAKILAGIDVEETDLSATDSISSSPYNTPSKSHMDSDSDVIEGEKEQKGNDVSPESKLLQPPVLAKLMSPNSSMMKALNTTKLLEQARFSWQENLKNAKWKQLFPKLETKPATFHHYQKWANLYPLALIRVIQQTSFPLLFLRQLSQKAVGELGQYLLNQQILDYLEYLKTTLHVKRQLQHITGWLASLKIIKLPAAVHAILIKESYWTKLITFFPPAAAIWKVIKNKSQTQYVALIHGILPTLFSRIAQHSDYSNEKLIEMTIDLGQMWNIYDTNEQLKSAIQSLIGHDWTELRALLKKLKYNKCLVVNKTLSY